jgi:Ca-activated chloride channel family protein
MNNVGITLSGETGRSRKTFVYENLDFPLRNEQNDFLPRLWATRRVGWLMEQIRTNGEQQELRDEIVDLGTRYGIVTPYTSYLALEPNAYVRDVTSGNMVNRNQALGNFKAAPARPADAAATTGAIAVAQSKRARQQQEVLRDERDTPSSAVKSAKGKTFYLRDKAWIDSEFRADKKLPETVVKFASSEYFELLKAKPQLSEFFALGESVIVVFEGRVYRVEPAAN